MQFKELLKEYENFIFDFDGVILDTVEIKNKIFYDFFLPYGKNVAKKIQNYHIKNLGINRFVKFKYIFENIIENNINEDSIKKTIDLFSLLLKKKLKKSKKINGFDKFISNLSLNNKDCYIISSAPTFELDFLIKKNNLNSYFIKYYGSPKSKYENFKLLVDEFNIELNSSIYFGDTKNDLIFAEKNNIDFIGVGLTMLNVRNKDIIDDFRDINYK